jgi:hypothetical protein
MEENINESKEEKRNQIFKLISELLVWLVWLWSIISSFISVKTKPESESPPSPTETPMTPEEEQKNQ